MEPHTLTLEEELDALLRETERLYRQNGELREENETLRQHLKKEVSHDNRTGVTGKNRAVHRPSSAWSEF